MLVTGTVRGRRLATPVQPARPLRALALATLLVPAPALALGPVTGLSAGRSGQDLLLSWSPSPPPVQGYRVYRSRTADCASLELVYDGPNTSWTEVGAFDDPAAALYGVAVYDPSGESCAVGPVYKYPFDLPHSPGDATAMRLASLPPMTGPVDSVALCADLNAPPPPGDPRRVTTVWRHDASTADTHVQSCSSSIAVFGLTPHEAYGLLPLARPCTVYLWGRLTDPESIDLPYPWLDDPDRDCDYGLHHVSLPWDHAYADLAEIAAEIPQAVRVLILNPNPGPGCSGAYLGLSRASSADPWTGTNVSLIGRRGEGVVIAVETAPVDWTPRRLCTAFSPCLPPANLPPVAEAGGPYDASLCSGGIIGIWLDGEASFDPDGNTPLSYEWTSTCSGTIADPFVPLTAALFDCNPCVPLDCTVSLRVTDALGARDTDVEPVLSRRSQSCIGVGNQLLLTRQVDRVRLDWSLAPPARNYVAMRDQDRALGSPERLACSPATTIEVAEGTTGLVIYQVDGMDEDCASR